jgi:pyruvate dehydrogenase E1 component beta subunit
LKIVACSTPYNAKGLLKSAIRDENPVLFFEHVLLYNLKEDLPSHEYLVPLNRAEVVRSGKDVTILTYSRMRHHVMQAVPQLQKEGIDPEVIDLISLKPLDLETIGESICKTHRVIIVEECMKTGGIGAELTASIDEHFFDELDAPVLRLASQDIPTPYNGMLERLTIVQPGQIVEAVQKMVTLQV